MERNHSKKLLEIYGSALRRSNNPAVAVTTAINAITDCPNEKQELLDVLQEKIHMFGLASLGLMQTAISNTQEVLLQKLEISGFFKKIRINKELSSCQDVAIFLATTALEMQNSTPR